MGVISYAAADNWKRGKGVFLVGNMGALRRELLYSVRIRARVMPSAVSVPQAFLEMLVDPSIRKLEVNTKLLRAMEEVENAHPA